MEQWSSCQGFSYDTMWETIPCYFKVTEPSYPRKIGLLLRTGRSVDKTLCVLHTHTSPASPSGQDHPGLWYLRTEALDPLRVKKIIIFQLPLFSKSDENHECWGD